MNADLEASLPSAATSNRLSSTRVSWTVPIVAGAIAWVGIAIGFFGLNMLLHERPQFAGLPVRFGSLDLVQDSPSVVLRKISDDVSLVRDAQPEQAHVIFSMQARRDYRGLRTIIDMQGRFTGQFTIANPFNEPVFVLFKCRHPHTEHNPSETVTTSALNLQADGEGMQENTSEAWLWSGEIGPQQKRQITVSYRAASVTGVRYAIAPGRGMPAQFVRAEIQVEDLPNMYFESAEGRAEPVGDRMVWERRNFLPPEHFSARIAETRNLYTAMNQLIEIGPLVSLLSLATMLAVTLTRRRLTTLQIFTLSAGYAFYFPLVLYLSAKFRFPVALAIALLAPGVLMLNYARWLLGFRVGVLGGAIFLLLYQLFPTLAAFAGWNRGMVLLCLSGVTLFVLIQLQNYTLRREAAALAAMVALAATTAVARGQEVQVIIPGKLADSSAVFEKSKPQAVLSYGIARYSIEVEERYLNVRTTLALEVLKSGTTDSKLFHLPVHLVAQSTPSFAKLVTSSNLLALEAIEAGLGELQFNYRAPLLMSGNQTRATVPLLNVPAGTITLRSRRGDLEIEHGHVWNKNVEGEWTQYEIGTAGADALNVSWTGGAEAGQSSGGLRATTTSERLDQLYGIRITESQQLTVVHSDGSCTHFAEFQLPRFHPHQFSMEMPSGGQIISVSVDGIEQEQPKLIDQRLQIELGPPDQRSQTRRVSLRLSLPKVRLGFIGFAEFDLPQTGSTIGTLQWTVVFPSGFQTQVISSGLDRVKQPPDLSLFGDYGKVLKSHDQTAFFKNLLPPIPVKVRIKYQQMLEAASTE